MDLDDDEDAVDALYAQIDGIVKAHQQSRVESIGQGLGMPPSGSPPALPASTWQTASVLQPTKIPGPANKSYWQRQPVLRELPSRPLAQSSYLQDNKPTQAWGLGKPPATMPPEPPLPNQRHSPSAYQVAKPGLWMAPRTCMQDNGGASAGGAQGLHSATTTHISTANTVSALKYPPLDPALARPAPGADDILGSLRPLSASHGSVAGGAVSTTALLSVPTHPQATRHPNSSAPVVSASTTQRECGANLQPPLVSTHRATAPQAPVPMLPPQTALQAATQAHSHPLSHTGTTILHMPLQGQSVPSGVAVAASTDTSYPADGTSGFRYERVTGQVSAVRHTHSSHTPLQPTTQQTTASELLSALQTQHDDLIRRMGFIKAELEEKTRAASDSDRRWRDAEERAERHRRDAETRATENAVLKIELRSEHERRVKQRASPARVAGHTDQDMPPAISHGQRSAQLPDAEAAAAAPRPCLTQQRELATQQPAQVLGAQSNTLGGIGDDTPPQAAAMWPTGRGILTQAVERLTHYSTGGNARDILWRYAPHSAQVLIHAASSMCGGQSAAAAAAAPHAGIASTSVTQLRQSLRHSLCVVSATLSPTASKVRPCHTLQNDDCSDIWSVVDVVGNLTSVLGCLVVVAESSTSWMGSTVPGAGSCDGGFAAVSEQPALRALGDAGSCKPLDGPALVRAALHLLPAVLHMVTVLLLLAGHVMTPDRPRTVSRAALTTSDPPLQTGDGHALTDGVGASAARLSDRIQRRRGLLSSAADVPAGENLAEFQSLLRQLLSLCWRLLQVPQLGGRAWLHLRVAHVLRGVIVQWPVESGQSVADGLLHWRVWDGETETDDARQLLLERLLRTLHLSLQAAGLQMLLALLQRSDVGALWLLQALQRQVPADSTPSQIPRHHHTGTAMPPLSPAPSSNIRAMLVALLHGLQYATAAAPSSSSAAAYAPSEWTFAPPLHTQHAALPDDPFLNSNNNNDAHVSAPADTWRPGHPANKLHRDPPWLRLAVQRWHLHVLSMLHEASVEGSVLEVVLQDPAARRLPGLAQQLLAVADYAVTQTLWPGYFVRRDKAPSSYAMQVEAARDGVSGRQTRALATASYAMDSTATVSVPLTLQTFSVQTLALHVRAALEALLLLCELLSSPLGPALLEELTGDVAAQHSFYTCATRLMDWRAAVLATVPDVRSALGLPLASWASRCAAVHALAGEGVNPSICVGEGGLLAGMLSVRSLVALITYQLETAAAVRSEPSDEDKRESDCMA